MKVLITGGAGYIGTELVKKLSGIDKIEKIIVFDNLSRKNYGLFLNNPVATSEKIKFINGNILDSRKVKDVLKGVDVVFHLAAKVTTPFANDDPHHYEQVNRWGTAELVNIVENSSVEKLVYLSSASVYGYNEEVADEDVIPNPVTAYAISKLQGENQVRRLQNKLSVFVIRCGNVYGFSNSMRFDAVVNRFAFESRFYRKIYVNGSGEQQRAFIHVDTLINVLSGILNEKIDPGTYNLMSENVAINDIAIFLKKIFPDLDIHYVNQNIKFKSIIINPDLKIYKHIKYKPLDIFESLESLQKDFTF